MQSSVGVTWNTCKNTFTCVFFMSGCWCLYFLRKAFLSIYKYFSQAYVCVDGSLCMCVCIWAMIFKSSCLYGNSSECAGMSFIVFGGKLCFSSCCSPSKLFIEYAIVKCCVCNHHKSIYHELFIL